MTEKAGDGYVYQRQGIGSGHVCCHNSYFRIALQGFLDFKKLFIANNHLTYYQQSSTQVTSVFKKWSLNWWKRRKEAHDFTKYLFKKNNIKKKITFDEYLTNVINLFIKK